MSCKTLAVVAATLLLVGCEPIAETTDWNADADHMGYDEWAPGFHDAGWFEAWDTDRDNRLSEGEWRAGLGDRFGTYDAYRWGPYPDWDTDRSGYLSDAEFGRGMFDHYDTNGNSLLVGEEIAKVDEDWP